MKAIWLGLAAAACALRAPAHATLFNFDLVYWEDGASPPADPDPSNVAHFRVDDQLGGTISHLDQPTGIWTYGHLGTYFGLPFQDADIDIYNDYWGGGFTFVPMAGGEPDYDNMLDFTGPSVLGGAPGAYQILTGVYDYTDEFAPGTLRVTITQVDADAVPEPAVWAMMLGGLAMVGARLRSQRARVRFA